MLVVALLALAQVNAVNVVESARVLGFSEDGKRALVEERTVGPVGGGARERLVSYVVMSANGRDVEVMADGSVRVSGVRAQLVDGDACRTARETLEKALVGFRTVRVRQGACAERLRRTLVDEIQQPPSPLMPGSNELVALQKRIQVPGDVFVNEDGPLVVVISTDTNAAVARGVVERVFLRADPRVNKRWPDPPL